MARRLRPHYPPRPEQRKERLTTATFVCPLCRAACLTLFGLPTLTATFDEEGIVRSLSGCKHAEAYGLLDQPQPEAEALESAARTARWMAEDAR